MHNAFIEVNFRGREQDWDALRRCTLAFLVSACDMRFAEIADSDDSESEEAGRDIHAADTSAGFAGGIAERAKERSRSARTALSRVIDDAVDVEAIESITEPLSDLPPSARERKRRRVVNDDDDDNDDDVDDLVMPATKPIPAGLTSPVAALPPKPTSKSEKQKKTKTKKDRRKALAPYEAPEVEDSTLSSSLVPHSSDKGPTSQKPPSNVEPTPGLPTPLSFSKEGSEHDGEPDIRQSTKSRGAKNNVKDSQPSQLVAPKTSLARQQDRTTKLQSENAIPSATTDAGGRKKVEIVISDAEDNDDDDIVLKPRKKQTTKKATSRAKEALQVIVNTDPAKPTSKKKGRQKREDIVESTDAVDELTIESPAVTTLQGAEEDGGREGTLPELEKENVSDIGREVNDVIAEDDIATPSKPAPVESKQEELVKAEPGKVVNYAAAGRSLPIKTTTGPRYRVGLSKRIKVDSLHQNIVRKYP